MNSDNAARHRGLRPFAVGLGVLVAAISLSHGQAAPRAPVDSRPIFERLAEEVTTKLLDSPEYQARLANGRKPRVVVGDIRNNSDNEGVRVEDIFNEIRNTFIASGTARLFTEGELNADLVISPELTSSLSGSAGRRQHCYTLQLTTSTISGEYVTAHSAKGCE